MGWLDRLKAAVGLGPVMARHEALLEPAVAPAVQRAAGPREPPIGGGRIGPLPLSLQLQRIGGSITPQQVSQTILLADTGYMWQLVDLANEAKQRDCHLQSVLQTRELAISGLEWQITAPKSRNRAKPRAKDQAAADFIEDVLRALDIPPATATSQSSLEQLFAHLAGANYLGYAVAENCYEKVGSKIIASGFDAISQRRFVFDQADGRLRWCDVYAPHSGSGAYPGIDLREKYPGQFIQFQPRVTGDVPCREGLVRVLMWAALFRNWDLRDWLTLAELAWKPWRTGQYEKNAKPEDIDNLEAILLSMSASGIATYPAGTEVKVEWPKNPISGNSAHQQLFDAMGAEMSKVALGQTLTTEQGSKGSQALGRVHDNVRGDIREADARAIAAVIRRDLIAPLVRMNFGADVAIPLFSFVTEDAADLQMFSSAIKNLREAGTRIPAKHVRDVAGIPEPEDGEELLGDGVEDDAEEDDPNEPEPGPEEPTDGSKEEGGAGAKARAREGAAIAA